MNKKITLSKARIRLFFFWLGAVIALTLFMIIQTLNQAFEITTNSGELNLSQDVWAWFVPLTFPTLTLMLGIIGASALREEKEVFVKKSFYTITILFSVLYLFLLAVLIFLWPVFKEENPLKTFSNSNFYLGPLQGLVIAAIGFLFSSKEE